MRIIKRVLIVIGTVLLLLNLVGLFFKREQTVSRSATIAFPRKLVLAILARPSEFHHWDPWSQMDTTIVFADYGPPGGVGAGYTWTSSDMGEGRWEIVSVTDSSVVVHLTFGSTRQSTATFYCTGNDVTTVTWSLTTDLGPIPMFRLVGPLFSSAIGSDFEEGLKNFANYLRDRGMGRVESITVTNIAPFPIICMRESIPVQQIGEAIARMYGTMMASMTAQGVQLAANRYPMVVYHTWEANGITDMEACIPVNKQRSPTQNASFRMFDGGTFVVAQYYGRYEDLSVAHDAIKAYAKANGVMLHNAAIEEYISDPQATPEPKNLRTDVWYRIQ